MGFPWERSLSTRIRLVFSLKELRLLKKVEAYREPGPEGERNRGPAEKPFFDCKAAHLPPDLTEGSPILSPGVLIPTKENGREPSILWS